jgi:hypothetical protein
MMDENTYAGEVAGRRAEILNAAAGRPLDLWNAHAHLTLGRAAPDALVQAAARSLAPDHLARIGGAGPFEVLPAALLLCRWESSLPGEAVGLLRQAFTVQTTLRGNTENHWLMYYTGMLLVAERWLHEGTQLNGLPAAAIVAEATRWILGTIQRTALWGHHEYDSPQYHMEHLAAYVGLHEHARDPHLRQQVRKMIDLLVGDMALEYFRGSWAGGHSREGYRQNTWTRVGPVQTLQYLWFGGEAFDAAHHLHSFAISSVVAGYRPHPLFAALALDRSQAHVVRKSRPPRTLIRHTERDAAPVRKYTYMSRSFAVGTTQLGLPGPPAGPIDLVSWDLTWHAPAHQGKISANHPYLHPGRFSAFLSPLPQAARRAIGDDKPYLQRPDRLFGASPFEQLMQHRGLVVALYRLPEDDEAPFVNLFLPRSLPWVHRQQWLLADAGPFFVAVRPLGPYTWERIRESSNDSIMVTGGDQIEGWLLRLTGRRTGLVLEAVEADEVGDFDAFVDRRTAQDVDLSHWSDAQQLAVMSLQGAVLAMGYDGEHTVDGVRLDYDAWPLYEAPGAAAACGTGRVVFRHGDDALELDFGVDATRSVTPMRVIG